MSSNTKQPDRVFVSMMFSTFTFSPQELIFHCIIISMMGHAVLPSPPSAITSQL